ncbi:hypothetical protein EV360DRAFT_73689 [Lentinula raphanica]|nr:hypothetical protein EV360DRAFT_73689 [Lentinula raphanica]
MELLQLIDNDLKLAQNTWDKEVERRAEYVSEAGITAKEDRKSFIQLASETSQLLSHVISSTDSAKQAFDDFDTTQNIPLANWLPRNTRVIRNIILQMSMMSEQMSEDPELKQSFVLQVETAYSEGVTRSKAKFRKHDLRNQTLLVPKRQQMRTLLTTGAKLDCFFRDLPIAKHLLTPTMIQNDTLTPSVSALNSLTPQLQQNNENNCAHVPNDFEKDLRNLSGETSFQALMSSFLIAKEQKLRMVLNVVEQFRVTEETVASRITEAHETLQARRENLQECLSLLDRQADHALAHVNHQLDILHGKPICQTDRLTDPLDFGQAQTTEYLEDLWTIALRLLPLQKSTSLGDMKNRVLDEMRRFGLGLEENDIAVPKSNDISIHSSFMTIIEGKRFGYQAQSVLDTVQFEQIPEENLIDEDARGSFFVASSGSSPPTLQTLAEEFACVGEAHPLQQKGNETMSTQNYTATEEARTYRCNIQHESTSVLHEYASVSVQHESTLALQVNSSVVGFCGTARIICITEFSSLFTHPRNIWMATWGYSVNVFLHFMREYSTVITIFLLLAGFILGLRLKNAVDHLILEVSHQYLPSEFRQMLRHDAESALIIIIVFLLHMPSKWCQQAQFTVRGTSPINGIALSEDAHYLAIAYGICVDIWDIKNSTTTTPLAQYSPDLEDRPISFLTWSPGGHRLAVCFEGGLTAIFIGGGFPVLRPTTTLPTMGKEIEIRYYLDDHDDPRWDVLKSLPTSSFAPTGSGTGDIQSIHSFTQNRMLVSYENGITDFQQTHIDWERLWRFEQSNEKFLTYMHEATMTLPGVINDVSPKGTVLVAVAGTYQVLLLGSTTAQNIFVPRDPKTGYPQSISCARYLSDDLIIGAGAGQTKTAYRADEDSGWIVTGHGGGRVICWKTRPLEVISKEVSDWTARTCWRRHCFSVRALAFGQELGDWCCGVHRTLEDFLVKTLSSDQALETPGPSRTFDDS